MGIQNLLPQLKSVMDAKSVSEYAGKKVGIDAYAWLHRGAYTCSQELCLGQPTTKWLDWCVNRVRLLLGHKVIPVLVFDGGRLSEKDKTEKGRRDSREKNRATALSLLEAGDREGANKFFQKAVDITPQIARTFKEALRKMQVEFVNAPYEADAQLAFLSKTGYIVSVITEDSDLLVFGCHRVLYKMDGAGNGFEIRLKNLDANQDLSFQGWSHEMFQQMCIFAGCDYLDSLPNVGIKKAHSYMQQHRTYDKVIRRIRLDGKTTVPASYDKEFEKAFYTFKHQRVYDPISKTLVHLTPLDDDFRRKFGDETHFLGAHMEDDLACGIAEGRIDPETKLPFVDPTPSQAISHINVPSNLPSSTQTTLSFTRQPSAGAFVSPPIQTTAPGGWMKKHSTAAHHDMPNVAPIEYTMRVANAKSHGLDPHAVASRVLSDVSSYHSKLTSALSQTQQKVLDTCGALTEGDEVFLSVPAALKHDFRPPRRKDAPSTGALHDLTNKSTSIASLSQHTPVKSASTVQSLLTPVRLPQKSASSSDVATRIANLERSGGLFDRFAYRANRTPTASGGIYDEQIALAGVNEMKEARESEEVDEYGFSQDAAAELELEHEQQQVEEDLFDQLPQRFQLPTSTNKRKCNFLSRSTLSSTASNSLRATTSTPTTSWKEDRNVQLVQPPAAAALPFYSPPSVSPSPPAPRVSTTPVASKYFSSAPQTRAFPASTYVPPVAVPDSTHFLCPTAPTPAAIPSLSKYSLSSIDSTVPPAPTFASLALPGEDENEGRIDDDMPDEMEDEMEDGGGSNKARKGRGRGTKRSSSMITSGNEKRLKSFISPLVQTSRSRLTLSVSSAVSGPLSLMEQFGSKLATPPQLSQQISPSSAGSEGGLAIDTSQPQMLHTPSPITPSDGSPSPVPFKLPGVSASACQPFRPLTIQPRSSTATVDASSFNPRLQLQPASRVSSYIENEALPFYSPPASATPPSPTPSPIADPSPSPSPEFSPSVTAPFATAGFCSQPSDVDDDDA